MKYVLLLLVLLLLLLPNPVPLLPQSSLYEVSSFSLSGRIDIKTELQRLKLVGTQGNLSARNIINLLYKR
jgi:hypothetical protein